MAGSLKRVARRIFAMARPGGGTPLARYLDEAAARRTLLAMISKTKNFDNARWLGRGIWQFPLGAWVLQEVVSAMRPDFILETGTFLGGSAHFYASLFDCLGHGEVVTVDPAPKGTIPHPRITYIRGSSTDPQIVAALADRLKRAGASKVLVVLDSDHTAEHVRRELEAFAPLVPPGSYIHVQDGCIDELPCFQDARPGPKVAAKAFLRDHPEFVRDTEIEFRYIMTFHPYGWLKRLASKTSG